MFALLRIAKLLPTIVTAVRTVEKLYHKDPQKPQPQLNSERQQAAVDLTGELILILEGVTGKDLFDTPEVQAIVREAIDLVVRLEQVVAKVQAAAPPATFAGS